jgi:hypothetical protein
VPIAVDGGSFVSAVMVSSLGNAHGVLFSDEGRFEVEYSGLAQKDESLTLHCK